MEDIGSKLNRILNLVDDSHDDIERAQWHSNGNRYSDEDILENWKNILTKLRDDL